MRSVVFYISGHGFGHASRQIEVIHALAALRPAWHILLRTAVSPSLLERSLRVPYELLPGPCDSGIAQTDSVTHDDEATTRETRAFYSRFDDRIREDVARLASAQVLGIVGDIPPLAFEVAAHMRVPSVAITNFTWDWIYDTHDGLSAEHALLARMRAAYGNATIALRLPLSPPLEVFPRVEPVHLVARHPSQPREETRRVLGLPLDRRVALLSFGGYGLQRLDVGGLDCLKDWTVLMTDRTASTAPPSPSVMFISEERLRTGLRYENLITAADVVVTKPGYGIISECAAAGTAMLYTSRGQFREYDVLVEQMPAFLRCRFLGQQDLFAGRWFDALTALMNQAPPPHHVHADGAQQAALRISELFSRQE